MINLPSHGSVCAAHEVASSGVLQMSPDLAVVVALLLTAAMLLGAMSFDSNVDRNGAEQPPDVRIRSALAEDAPAFAAIYNHWVRTSTATYQGAPIDASAYIEKIQEPESSAIVASIRGRVVGFAFTSPYAAIDGLRITRRVSIYLQDGMRGFGVGSNLLGALIDAVERRRSVHLLVAEIDSRNFASCSLVRKFGFQLSGWLPEAGDKNGQYHDLLLLSRRVDPDSAGPSEERVTRS